MAKQFSIVGKKTTRIDAYERVTGQAKYTRDVQLPGMLYARVLRSPHPHARILSIDTSKAENFPGVRAVIHHKNAKVRWHSGSRTAKRFIFNNPVRYVGDPVAAVAATDPHIAEDALGLIEIRYEKLPYVWTLKRHSSPALPRFIPRGTSYQDAVDLSLPMRTSGVI